MQYPITIKFTPSEWKLIEDRLAVPDAIAEAMTDDAETVIPGDKERFYGAAYEMWLHGREVTLRGTYDRDVLEDAVEGSTMPAKLHDEVMWGEDATAKECRALLRHIPKIEAKLEAAGLTGVRFPKG